MQVQLGYFGKFSVELLSILGVSSLISIYLEGTCVSTNTNADDIHSNTTKTACVQHLQYDDDEPLVSQFVEELSEKNEGTDFSAIGEPLGKILPIAELLRRKVFPAGVPISFLVIYLLSIMSFWILLASSNRSKTYKAVFAATALLNAYGLTIGFIVATTTWQACRGLIFPAQGDTGIIEPGVFVTENTALQNWQWAVVGLSVALQLCVAGLFVQRRAYGDEASLKPSINIKSYKLCC